MKRNFVVVSFLIGKPIAAAFFFIGTLTVAATPTPTLTNSATPANQAACESITQQTQQLVDDFTPSASSICLKDDDCIIDNVNFDKTLPNSGVCAEGPRCQPLSKAQAYDILNFIQFDRQLNQLCQQRETLNCPRHGHGCSISAFFACINQQCVSLPPPAE